VQHLISEEGLEFLNGLLVYDHQKRFTAQEAMAHRFFEPVLEAARNGHPGEPAPLKPAAHSGGGGVSGGGV
jgi:hypothetical protein